VNGVSHASLAATETVPCLLCGSGEAHSWLDSQVQLAPATGEVYSFVRCAVCGLVYLSPRPLAAEIHRYYPPSYLPHRGPEAWGRWAPLVRSAERRMDRKRVRLVTAHAALAPGSRVLDVGCGRPTFLRELRRRTGAEGVGTDVSEAGWEAEDRADLRLVRGSFPEVEEELRGVAGDGFCAVTLWHALEHDYGPLETLRALSRLAAPGAVLVVEVPDLSSLTARLHGPDWAGLHTPRHPAAYTAETLAATVQEAGWKVIRHLRYGTLDPYVLWWLGRRIRRGDPLDRSLEGGFPAFLGGKLAFLPLALLGHWVPLGVQTVVARRG
jgi:SAM-dependent methyltransferase